jgi:hypothetical protein
MIKVPETEPLVGIFTTAMPRPSASEQLIAMTLSRQLTIGAPVGVSRPASAAELSEAQLTNTLDHLPGSSRGDERQVGRMTRGRAAR